MGVTNTDIVNTAKEFKGKLKYVFGSNDIKGGTGDCSSFTEYIYALHGIDIGADTNAQYAQGYGIEKEDIEAGDLIFFKDTYNSGHLDGVSHVGIAVNKNQFIHLSSSGCIISNLSNNYYTSHYLAAKRLPDVSYENVTHETVEETETESRTEDSEVGLTWWGDIVKVVVIVLVLVGAVAFLSLSFFGAVKVPKIDTSKIMKAGAENE